MLSIHPNDRAAADSLPMPVVTIAGRKIGACHRPYVVAEMSGNHGGDISRAHRLIDAAKAAGADAVKIQTYTADTITIDHDGPGFILKDGLWSGRKLFDLYKEAHTPWEWHAELFSHAASIGITLFSSPFDFSAVDLLERLNSPAYKIASFEIIDLPLIRRVASTGRPIIISTGMANLGEVADAVSTALAAGNQQIVLLHCTSGYPAPICDAHLRTIPNLSETFGVPVGLSDHTHGIAVPLAAVVLGAVMIEKHFTLARADGGPDAAFSLESEELAAMVDGIGAAYAALGRVHYGLKPSESAGLELRRSLYIVSDVGAGTVITRQHVRSIRPGYGLAPRYLDDVIGKQAARNLRRGEPVSWGMLVP